MESKSDISIKLPANAYTELKPGEKYIPFIPPEKIIPEVTSRSILWGIFWAVVFSFSAAYLGYRAVTEPDPALGYNVYGEPHSLVSRGAAQFGVGYGGALPGAYYEGQTEYLPKLKQLEAEAYADVQGIYQAVKANELKKEAALKAQLYQEYAPVYSGSSSTVRIPYEEEFY